MIACRIFSIRPRARARRSDSLEHRLAFLAESGDSLLVILGLAQLLVSMALDIETGAQARIIGRIEHALDSFERKRRHRGQLVDDLVDRAVERRGILNDAGEQPPLVRLRSGDASPV